MKTLIVLATACALAACSAHSPFIVANTVDGHPAAAAGKYPAHDRPVIVTAAPLPPDLRYEVIEQIEVGKVWYGSTRAVDTSLAARARAVGADAVIMVRRWHQPSGWSWAAPHGSGQAVKLLDPDEADLRAISGERL